MAKQKRYPHIFLKDTSETSQFTSPRGGSSKLRLPPRDRDTHFKKLRLAIDQIWRQTRQVNQHRKAVSHSTRDGIYLEFQGKAGYQLVTKSLENLPSGIRLLNVREEKDTTTEEPLMSLFTMGIVVGYPNWEL